MSLLINKVLISDNVDKKCSELLEANGIEVIRKYNLKQEELIKALEGCNGLIVRSETKVTKDVINSVKSLKVIGRAGTGVDNIDISAATRRGIIVLNAPNGNAVSACELTCFLISDLARNVTGYCQLLKKGQWNRKAYDTSELDGKTLAIIGLGRIGKEVAARMKHYGLEIIGYDPFVTAEEAKLHSIRRLELNDIWPLADYITVHTPLINQTRNLINKSVFEQCKRGVKIVNAARGGIVNEADLLEALDNGSCAAAALDVYSEEPPLNSDILRKLITHPKVTATPHIGASTNEAQIRVAVEVAEQFISLKNPISGYSISGLLNAPVLLASRVKENGPWLQLAELLGRVLVRVTKVTTLTPAKIKISLAGPDIGQMKFLSSCVLYGILSGNVKNGYNIINSPLYANEAGLSVYFEDTNDKTTVNQSSKNVLKILVDNGIGMPYSVQGTIIDDIPYLLQINDSVFTPGTAKLSADIQIYGCSPAYVNTALNAAYSANEKIMNISIAYGKTVYIVLLAVNNSQRKFQPPENVEDYNFYFS